MKKTNMAKLPKQIYVYWDGDPPDRFLNVRKTPQGIEDGVEVGVYKLDAVKKQKVTEELV